MAETNQQKVDIEEIVKELDLINDLKIQIRRILFDVKKKTSSMEKKINLNLVLNHRVENDFSIVKNDVEKIKKLTLFEKSSWHSIYSIDVSNVVDYAKKIIFKKYESEKGYQQEMSLTRNADLIKGRPELSSVELLEKYINENISQEIRDVKDTNEGKTEFILKSLSSLEIFLDSSLSNQNNLLKKFDALLKIFYNDFSKINEVSFTLLESIEDKLNYIRSLENTKWDFIEEKLLSIKKDIKVEILEANSEISDISFDYKSDIKSLMSMNKNDYSNVKKESDSFDTVLKSIVEKRLAIEELRKKVEIIILSASKLFTSLLRAVSANFIQKYKFRSLFYKLSRPVSDLRVETISNVIKLEEDIPQLIYFKDKFIDQWKSSDELISELRDVIKNDLVVYIEKMNKINDNLVKGIEGK